MAADDLMRFSEPDSRRFGMKVVRGIVMEPNIRQIAKSVLSQRVDIAILRCPAGKGSIVHGLARSALPVTHADTLVYYEADLTKWTPNAIRNADLTFRASTERDLPVLRELIGHTFAGYVSHYHANVLFGAEDILAGYKEWAEGHALGEGKKLWLCERRGELQAFAACSEDAEGTVGEGVLYGVAPRAAGGGIYGDLIRHTQADFHSRGFRSMSVSTQVSNFAVQKVWTREGFHLVEAWDTLHVNALLSCGELVHAANLTFTAEQIRVFAEVSGDENPVHIDESAAIAAGFQGRIAHGVMAAAEFSRILGTKVPGPGTILSHLDLGFFKPIVADAMYRFEVRIPGGLRSGTMHVVAAILDHSGEICCLARADVVLRQASRGQP